MKIRKRKFVIVKMEDDRYTIALRISPEHPLDRKGFPDKRAAKKRLNEYIRKVNETL